MKSDKELFFFLFRITSYKRISDRSDYDRYYLIGTINDYLDTNFKKEGREDDISYRFRLHIQNAIIEKQRNNRVKPEVPSVVVEIVGV